MTGIIAKIADTLGLGGEAEHQGPTSAGGGSALASPGAGGASGMGGLSAGGGVGEAPDVPTGAGAGGTEPIGGDGSGTTGAHSAAGTDPIRPSVEAPALDASPAHGLRRVSDREG
ncbi:MAG TPA: hypothetical protein VEZ70_13390 [Allosphingosinicella sp.]|nr:hypothetical protein [Allosphingosinicella sp.]